MVEKEAELGGLLRRVNRLAPRGEKAADLVKDLVSLVDSKPNLKTMLGTEVVSIGGVIGNYEVAVRDPDGAEVRETVGCMVIATGAVPFKPEGLFGYDGRNVITQIELEDRMRGEPLDAKDVVMIQCVGARCAERQYCSRVCCVTAVKNALYIKEQNPEARVHVLYRDMQMYGAENEQLLWEARGKGVRFDVYDVDRPPVVKEGKVEVYRALLSEAEEIPCDLVVLSTPLVAPEGSSALANLMRIPLDQNNFFMEAHAKLRPLDFATDGFSFAELPGTRQRRGKPRPRDLGRLRGPVRCS